ncbi:hypothetical protein ACIPSE_06705 [Streptomyces sp. NPDC090106]
MKLLSDAFADARPADLPDVSPAAVAVEALPVARREERSLGAAR